MDRQEKNDADEGGARCPHLGLQALAGYLLVVAWIGLFSGAQLLVQGRLDAPWNGLLIVGSVVVEYLGLAAWSNWMNRQVHAPALAERRSGAPVVLVSRGTPVESAVDEAKQVATTLHKPLLLVALVAQAESESTAWVDSLRQKLSAAGLVVSAQIIFTLDPEDTWEEVIGTMNAAHVAVGRPEMRRPIFQIPSRSEANHD